MSKKQGAFTILELLIVIAIIGVLASIVSVLLSGTKADARDARRQRDIHEIQTALNIYQSTYTIYPVVTGDSVVIDGTDELSLQLREADAIHPMPVDPIQSVPHVYTYYSNAEGTTYMVTYCLETADPCEREITP